MKIPLKNKPRGKRKSARAISTKCAMHIIFRSKKARGGWSFLLRARRVEEILQSTAKRYRLRIYKFANVGNHVHLLIHGQTKEGIQNFLRVIPQALAFLITGTRKGKALKERFWQERPFSRLVGWRRDFYNMLNYIEKNLWEGLGIRRDVVEMMFEGADNWEKAG